MKKFTPFLAKFNARQILIHFLAVTFIAYAFHTLAHFYDLGVAKASREATPFNIFEVYQARKIDSQQLTYFFLAKRWGLFFGAFAGFLMALGIARKGKLYWINTLIAFILSFGLIRLVLLDSPAFKSILWIPGRFFNSLAVELAINGALLLIAGSILLFSGKAIAFIKQAKH